MTQREKDMDAGRRRLAQWLLLLEDPDVEITRDHFASVFAEGMQHARDEISAGVLGHVDSFENSTSTEDLARRIKTGALG